LAYEKPEADVLLRPPRNIKKDRLVNWQLMLHTYGFIGVLQTISSFSMSYWYLQRKGIPFSDIWFSFGKVPDRVDADYYQEHLNIASSIYFVNLVVMQWFNLLATRTRRLSIVQHPPVFNKATQNLFLLPAVLFAVVMAIFWLYPSSFQRVLDTAPVPVEHWFLPFAFGFGVFLLDEARKFVVRKYPSSLLGKTAW
jgi:sodium/potassium-transporting ATPase subunit alpha